MERTNTYQLELFTAQGDSGALKPRTVNNPFLSYLRAYEKVILIIIGVALTSIVSFSLGVEKGKRISIQKNGINFDLAQKAQGLGSIQPVAKQPLRQQQPALKAAPVNMQAFPNPKPVIENKTTINTPAIKSIIGNYTIQVASYKSKTYAQIEADALKREGFVTLTLAKGNYIVLCVGNFNTKETAQSFATQFKKRYQGCTIRRL